MLEDLFPRLRAKAYQITSPQSWAYNCVAWAAGDAAHRWWPSQDDRDHWPADVEKVESLSGFQATFALLAYRVCDHAELEEGMERIAIFADAEGTPLHVARQLPSGRWTSKLGALEDIEHDLRDLEGEHYGQVVLVMQRPAEPA